MTNLTADQRERAEALKDQVEAILRAEVESGPSAAGSVQDLSFTVQLAQKAVKAAVLLAEILDTPKLVSYDIVNSTGGTVQATGIMQALQAAREAHPDHEVVAVRARFADGVFVANWIKPLEDHDVLPLQEGAPR